VCKPVDRLELTTCCLQNKRHSSAQCGFMRMEC
jgi:hypothetical protein